MNTIPKEGRHDAGHGVFEPNCGECAGFCCIALEIPPETAGVLEKTANAVCRHLVLSPSGVGHGCGEYAERRFLGYDTCVAYDCHGAGNLTTREALKRGWIRDDATFEPEARDYYDLCFRLAAFLDGEREIEASEVFRFGRKRPDPFREACAGIHARLVRDGTVTDADGLPSDPASVRNWFVEGIRHRGGFLTRLLRAMRP